MASAERDPITEVPQRGPGAEPPVVTGLFAPKTICSRERVPDVELLLPGTFSPWNFCTLELSLRGTFIP